MDVLGTRAVDLPAGAEEPPQQPAEAAGDTLEAGVDTEMAEAHGDEVRGKEEPQERDVEGEAARGDDVLGEEELALRARAASLVAESVQGFVILSEVASPFI